VLANDKITIDDLADAIGERLTVYQSETARKVLKVTKNTMKRFVKITKQTAPRRTGKFAKAIRSTVEDNGITGSKGIWYVGGKEYPLTHLLVNGHQLRQGGRTKGDPFLENALESVADEYIKGIEEAVKND
jgi:DNA-directed RNA polymerase specialized sigma54-like protein